MSGWPTGVTHRYFLHLDSIEVFRNAIPACNKPCNKFITENYYIVSKIITSGFVHDKPKNDPRTWFYNHNWHCATIACSLDNFTKHQELLSNSSWAPRSTTKPDVIIFETDVIIFCNKFITRFITSRYGIPRKSGRVKMQEISMGDSSGPPRHPKPSVDAWFCLLSSFWSDLVLRG